MVALLLLWKAEGAATLGAGGVIISSSSTIAFSGSWLNDNLLGFCVAESGSKAASSNSALVDTGNMAGDLQSAVVLIYDRKRQRGVNRLLHFQCFPHLKSAVVQECGR